MHYTNYTIVKNIEDATHWKSKLDNSSPVKDYIIPNKMYELSKLKDEFDDEEYFIRGEDGCPSVYYLCHKGDFIRK